MKGEKFSQISCLQSKLIPGCRTLADRRWKRRSYVYSQEQLRSMVMTNMKTSLKYPAFRPKMVKRQAREELVNVSDVP